MKRILGSIIIVGVLSFVVLGFMVTPAISGGPTDGFDIHVHAPHMMADAWLEALIITTAKEFREVKYFSI